MPLNLTANAQALLDSEDIQLAIILEIDGIDTIYSTSPLSSIATYGSGLTYGGGAIYGATTGDANVQSLVNLQGSSYNITQQLRFDQADVSSVQKLAINLVDDSEELTLTFSPGQVIDDILGRDAIIYIGFVEAEHPADSVAILNGKVDQFEASAGSVKIQVANPQDLARATILPKYSEDLPNNINDSVTSFNIANGSKLQAPSGGLTTYIRINDEVMQVTGIATNTVTVTRGAFNTVAAAHTSGDTVESIYILSGSTTQLPLELLLSGGDDLYLENQTVTSFVQTGSITQTNAVFLPLENGLTTTGVAVGDLVTITGATNAANNVTDAIITEVREEFNGTTLILGAESLVLEASTGGLLDLRSQYNNLPVGAGLKPKNVDVKQFQSLESTFGNQFFDYEIKVKDTITNLREFIANEIFKPSAGFFLPRKGRISFGIIQPPLNDTTTQTLNECNVKNADKIVMRRTTNKNFFNAIEYNFNEDILEDRFNNTIFTISAASINRISTRNKTLTVDAGGVLNNGTNTALINRQINRYLDAYQFAAETTTVDVLFKVGFGIEIGDSVVVDGSELFISDVTKGSRDFGPRVFTVVNKKLNVKTGDVSLDLIDLAFGSNLRFGVVSQSSFINTGSTTTQIFLKRSFGNTSQAETFKYSDYVGQIFKVRSQDYTFNEEVTLVSVDASTESLTVTSLSGAPLEDYIVECPEYGSGTDSNVKSFFKAIHVFVDPLVTVVAGVDNFSFEVSPADISKFTEGNPVEVRNDDFSVTSTNDTDSLPTVTNINTGTNIITVSRDLGFTPVAGYSIELIGFLDGGAPYALV